VIETKGVQSTLDIDFMRVAIGLAGRGLGNTFPNPAVGCVLVKDGLIVGRGWTAPGGRPHAETQAIHQAGSKAQGATVYVTLEPCSHVGQTPPCAKALIKAKISRLVVAVADPDPRVSGRGLKMVRDAGVSVTENVCQKEAWQANIGYFLSKTNGRPMFTLKLATDQAGQIPGPNASGDARWITSPTARQRGHLLRAKHDAVLFGIGTVMVDDPEYTCRLAGMKHLSPIRIVLDSHLRVQTSSKLLQSAKSAPIWIICGKDAKERTDLNVANVTVIQAPDVRPDPLWIAKELASRGITRVLIETGPTLVDAFIQADLIDEMAWFRSTKILTDGSVAAFSEKNREKLALTRQAVLQAGPDQLELYVKGT